MKNYLAISKCSLFCSLNHWEGGNVSGKLERVCSLLQQSVEASVRHILSYNNNFKDYDRDMPALIRALGDKDCAELLRRVYINSGCLELWGKSNYDFRGSVTRAQLDEISSLACDLIEYIDTHCKVPKSYINSAVA